MKFFSQVRPKDGITLVVGAKCHKGKADRRLLYPKALGMDMAEGEGVDVVHNLEKPFRKKLGQFDHIDCFSVLEHVKRPWLAAENIQDAMTDGATIFLAVPFVWRIHGYPSDYWRFTQASLPVLFHRIRWLQMTYNSDDMDVEKPPTAAGDAGKRWMHRTELFAIGRKE